MKRVILLGSTGTIGRATLDVAQRNRDRLRIVGLSAGKNCEALHEQITQYNPLAVAVCDADCALRLRTSFPSLKIYCGSNAATELVRETSCDVVVAAISGMAGLAPVVAAAEQGRVIALANKESLVAAGGLLMDLVKKSGASLLPIDSEHSAIWQAMMAWPREAVRKLILTASGGPFLGRRAEELSQVTVRDALAHPTWNMGGKISIDSATLMNKGLEIIEAHHLFNFSYHQIEVLIHPESIVHSLVEFIDGAQLAQCSIPDMRIPIQFALSFPQRWPADYVKNRYEGSKWCFMKPDLGTFRCLQLAIDAGLLGGAYPTVLNAANEVAVNSFLEGKISFLAIALIVEQVLALQIPVQAKSLSEVFAIDEWARRQAVTILKQRACKSW